MSLSFISATLKRASVYSRFVAAQYVIALVLAVVLVYHYGYDLRVIWLHALYLAELLLVQTALVLLVHRGLGRRYQGLSVIVVTSILSLMNGFLLTLYAANFASNAAWGGYVDSALAREAPAHIAALAALLGLHVAVLYAAMVLFLAVLYGLLFKTARLIVQEAAVEGDRPVSLSAGQRPVFPGRRAVLGAALFSGYVAFYSVFALGSGVPPTYRGEPLSSLFVAEEGTLPSNQYLSRIADQDRTLRRQYRVPAKFDRRNVILIVADSLRAASLPMYGYDRNTTPFLAGLAQKGHLRVIHRAVTMCPESLCGIISTLGSRDYSRITPGLFKLNDLLFDAGYQVHFILSGTHSWNGLRRLYGDSVSSYVDGTAFENYTVNDDRGVLAHLARQEGFRGRPAFFFFHLMTTHQFARTADFADGVIDGPRTFAWKNEGYYDKSIERVDKIIERIFALLEDKGYLRDSLVVILGDHGEAFGEHGEFGHIRGLYRETMEIPLLIYDRHGPRYPSVAYATQLDVAPTIVERLGLPVPDTWQGRSLLRAFPGNRLTVHQTTLRPPSYAVHYAEGGLLYKLITNKYLPAVFDNEDELHELTRDPGEQTNLLASASPELLALLRNRLVEYQQTQLPYWR